MFSYNNYFLIDMIRIFVAVSSMDVVGGIERTTSIQANYWADENDYEVYIITYTNPNENSYYWLSSRVRIINLDVEENLLNPLLNPVDKLRLISIYKKGFLGVLFLLILTIFGK